MLRFAKTKIAKEKLYGTKKKKIRMLMLIII